MHWSEFEAAEPEFAARVRKAFENHLHLTMATLRADGAPRISGTEAPIKSGDIWLGTAPGAAKARDRRRDARVALHSGTGDTMSLGGDAKVSGRAVEEHDPVRIAAAYDEVPEGALFFWIDLEEVAFTFIESEALWVDFWREGQPVRRLQAA